MGCHTWHYKRDNRPYAEVKESVINRKLKLIQSWKELLEIKRNIFELIDSLGSGIDSLTILTTIEEYRNEDWYPEATIEQINHNIKVLERQIQIIRKGLCKVATYRHDSGLTFVHNNIPYIDCEDFHDTFRISNYPEDVLLSYEDTMKFIEHKVFEGYNITLFENKLTGRIRLEEFWEKYPDGMIKFG